MLTPYKNANIYNNLLSCGLSFHINRMRMSNATKNAASVYTSAMTACDQNVLEKAKISEAETAQMLQNKQCLKCNIGG